MANMKCRGCSYTKQRQNSIFGCVRFAWLALVLIASSEVHANICFMLYQYADGCSEYAHRKNLKQWIASEASKDPSVTTWVYFNAFVSAPENQERPKFSTGPICGYNSSPLEDVWTGDGGQLLTNASPTKYERGYVYDVRSYRPKNEAISGTRGYRG